MATPDKPVRYGYLQESENELLHCADGRERCPTARTAPALKVRRLTVEEWRRSKRCGCALWFGSEKALAKLPASELGRIDARQPWEPIICRAAVERLPRGSVGCELPAVVVLDGLAAELAGVEACNRRRPGCKTADAMVRELAGLCAQHFAAWRPGVELPSLGWGVRLELSASERLSVELAAGKGATDGAGGAGAEPAGAGWSGGRRVARGRAAGAPAQAVTRTAARCRAETVRTASGRATCVLNAGHAGQHCGSGGHVWGRA